MTMTTSLNSITNEWIQGWAWYIFDYKLEWGSQENPIRDELRSELLAMDLSDDDYNTVLNWVRKAEDLIYKAAESFTLPENFRGNNDDLT